MNVYILTRDAAGLGAVKYDENDACVVVAANSRHARHVAADSLKGKGDEGRDVWLDRTRSKCRKVSTSKARLVLRSFNAG